MSDFHSRMSPSSAERTINCPAWVKAADEYGIESTSDAADLGSLAHHLAATCLTSAPNANYYVNHALPPDNDGNYGVKVTDEMAEHVNGYVDYIMNLKNNTLQALGGDPLLLEYHIEKRVGYRKRHKEAHGTADNITGRHFGPLHVPDFKYGVSPVSPIRNKQGMSYALFALETFGSFDPIFIHIYQPRIRRKSPVKIWKTSSKELREFEKVLFKSMRLADTKNAPFKEGGWCWFCPAKLGCPLKKDKRVAQVAEFFDTEDDYNF